MSSMPVWAYSRVSDQLYALNLAYERGHLGVPGENEPRALSIQVPQLPWLI